MSGYLHFAYFQDSFGTNESVELLSIEFELVLWYLSQRQVLREVCHGHPFQQSLLIQGDLDRIVIFIVIFFR